MCVPTSPAGAGPENACTSTPFSSANTCGTRLPAAHAQVDLAARRGSFEHLDAGLEILATPLARDRGVTRQRLGIEAVDEDRDRAVVRFAKLPTGRCRSKLHRPLPRSASTTWSRGVSRRRFGSRCGISANVSFSAGVISTRCSARRSPSTIFETVAGGRRDEATVRILLVEEQFLPGLDRVAFLDEHLRLGAREIGGLHGDEQRLGRLLNRTCRSAEELDVEALADRVRDHPECRDRGAARAGRRGRCPDAGGRSG
jgi:hypothetical protein